MCRPVGLEESHLSGIHGNHGTRECHVGRRAGGEWAGEAGLPAWQVEAAWRRLKERWLWEGTLGTLALQEPKDKLENPTKEKENSNPIYDQYQGAIWGHVTAIRIRPREAPLPRPDPGGGVLKFPLD